MLRSVPVMAASSRQCGGGCPRGARLTSVCVIFVGAVSKQSAQSKNMRGSSVISGRLCQESVFAAGFALLLTFTPALPAAIIGTNSPTQPLTAGRIAALPRAQQPAWKEYLERSTRQLRADQAFLRAETRPHGIKQLVVPPPGHSAGSIPLNNPAFWYGESEARRIADIVVSFQTPAGGWSKNLDLMQHRRAPGESFTSDNSSRYLGRADFDISRDAHWDYVGTFDNDATSTELRFLAKVIIATGTNQSVSCRAAFLRGLDYIFAAQYPNGGWPQVWPLQGGYHDAITCNDNAMLNVLALLRDVSETNSEFAFVPGKYPRVRRQASNAELRVFSPPKLLWTAAARFGASNTICSHCNPSPPAITRCRHKPAAKARNWRCF